MNTTFDGAYIFGGTKGTSKPVTVDSNGNLAYADKNGNGFGNPAIPDVSTGNDKTNAESQLSTSLKTEISQGVVVEYNDSIASHDLLFDILASTVACIDNTT